MERLKTERSRARRFLPSGVADPDIVSGKRDANPAESIAQNADHHGAIPLLPRGKGTATGVSIGNGSGNHVEAGAVNAIGDHGDGGEDGAAVGGADGVADGGANDGAVCELQKQIQSFNEAPEGHLAFVKEKIEPLLMK